MAHYFRQVSNFNYISLLPDAKISEYITVKNFFRRGQVRPSIFNNLAFFEKYSIEGDERADQVANKIYGDPTLDWIVFLSNNLINVQDEWPLPSYVFDTVMLEKYGSYEKLYSKIHHYETVEIKDSQGVVMLPSGIRVSASWKTNGNFIEVSSAKIQTLNSTQTTSTLTTQSNIAGIEIGSQVTISNVADSEFNGQFYVSAVIPETNTIVIQLNSVPTNSSPILSTPRVEEVHFTIGENSTQSGNSFYYEFYDKGLGYTIHIPHSTFVNGITNFDYEMEREEKKRQIYLLKPDYVGILLEDINNIMSYKKSSQYESRTLKRGDNSRIY